MGAGLILLLLVVLVRRDRPGGGTAGGPRGTGSDSSPRIDGASGTGSSSVKEPEHGETTPHRNGGGPLSPREELLSLLRWCGEKVYTSTLVAGPELDRLLALINSQGRESLLEIAAGEKDPHIRWTALSALCSLLSLDGKPLTSIGSYLWVETKDEAFITLLSQIVLDASLDAKLRGLAVDAVLALPPERAESILSILLKQPAREVDVLRVAEFYTRPLSPDFWKLALQRAIEAVGNPGSDERARGSAVAILRKYPESIVQLVGSYAPEQPLLMRRSIAAEGARLLGGKAELAQAGPLCEKLIDIALTTEDFGVQLNIIPSLGTPTIRERFGTSTLKALITLAEREGEEQVRIAAIRALTQGGYAGATQNLKSLANSPMQSIAREAIAALQKLGQ